MSLSESRIDLFQQIKEFDYLCMTDSLPGITGNYRSVYFALLSINNSKFWSTVFEVDFELALAISRVDKDTYRRAMNFFNENGLFESYQKGINAYARARVSLKVLGGKPIGNTGANTSGNATSNTGRMTVVNTDTDAVDNTAPTAHFNKTITKTKKQETIINNKIDFVAFEFLECFQRWLDYKKARKESYKTEDSLRACYNKLLTDSGNNPEIAAKIIELSIANNWAGLFPLKTNQQSSFNQQPATGRATSLLSQNERLKSGRADDLLRQNEELKQQIRKNAA